MGRRHHHIPAFYLARFTVGGTRESEIFVLDKKTGKQLRLKPDTTGFENHFYRLEGDANPDDQYVEKFFAEEVEGPVAGILQEIARTFSVPSRRSREHSQLMGFIALTHLRGLHGRHMLDEGSARAVKAITLQMLNTPGEWDARLAELGKTANDPGWSVKEMIDLVNSGDLKFELDKNSKLKSMLELSAPLSVLMRRRTWHVIGRREDSPPFLTSDQPVVPVWPPDAMHAGEIAAIATPGNSIVFPIDRERVLYGLSSGTPRGRQASPFAVEHLNAMVAFQAHRFVYCGTDEFRARLPGQRARGADGILEAHSMRRVLPSSGREPSIEEVFDGD